MGGHRERRPKGVEVNVVADSHREGVHGLPSVIPSPVEPAVHHALHPSPQRGEQRRDGQGGYRHNDGIPAGQRAEGVGQDHVDGQVGAISPPVTTA